ncbi:hypothetical protein BDY19DRAFT_570360 [Irpex rosettiformis]|uniref:Uncharacterized protein n=1 Tax=Irpex rosettiformis TaxID=378272 RepID=A0ACB8UCL8_9APHY|nr:hypothetical protein BDY19DRAFT_570360 [Irpex rosettiformis]
MPRFFPSFGHRSRENREQHQDENERYGDYGHRMPSSAWSRVVPNGKSREQIESSWEEEQLERPDSYVGHGAYPSRRPGPSSGTYDNHHHRPTVHDDSEYLSDSTIAEEYDGHYAHDNTIPIVQRESSLTRLQEVFADHAGSTRPVTEVNLPQQTVGNSPYPTAPDLLPHAASIPPVGQIHSTAELRNVYAEQQQRTLVPNMTAVSQHADIYSSQSRRAREKRPQYRDEPERPQYRSEYREEHRPRMRRNSSASSRSLGDDDHGYPPCVVVVERGRHGKKDTYYVIPGGAPVIFEDDKGNELTRVGDFSGRYRPQRQRPVIIEDSRGREIGR